MSAQQPTVGRVVHYVSRGSADGRFPSVCRAAVVTEVPDLLSGGPNTGPEGYVRAASLCVLNPTGQFFDQGVPHSAENEGGTWHWPERDG